MVEVLLFKWVHWNLLAGLLHLLLYVPFGPKPLLVHNHLLLHHEHDQHVVRLNDWHNWIPLKFLLHQKDLLDDKRRLINHY